MDYKLKPPSALDYFTSLVQSDDEFPLLETAISLAQDEFPSLDIQQVLSDMDHWAARLKRGDDVFDFGGVLGLLQRKGIDEDALVGDGADDALELGELPVRPGELAQHLRCLQGHGRRQREGSERSGHITRKRAFSYHVSRTCKENSHFIIMSQATCSVFRRRAKRGVPNGVWPLFVIFLQF